ncbi:MAG: formylglycine-generating enzyme family protein [Kiritimatiellae bacterium]|nr:formylglycine-generating enzyme family protein [Kiritimatiellia bacterium]
MNVKKIIMVGIMMSAVSVLAAVSITDVSAKQRYPWNGLIDITYTISGDVGSMTRPSMIMTAKDENTGLTYLASTFLSKPPMTAGTHTVTWNPIADALHITSDRMRMTISIEDNFPLYCLINVSGGSSATKYPVTYLDAIPSGGWTTAHKTNYIVMRWCPAGTYMMQGQRKVTLTKPFYIGIFEVTQKQYKNVMGNANGFWNMTGDAYPTSAKYAYVRGNMNYPSSTGTTSDSFVGKLKSKTGLANIDLPTEAQWEYACRAGTITELSSGKGLTPNNVKEVAGVQDGSIKTDVVGSHRVNPWGIYDMHGNAPEMCLDYYQDDVGTAAATDPKGPAMGQCRVTRGMGWDVERSFNSTWPTSVSAYTSTARGFTDGENTGCVSYSSLYWNSPFRLCMTLQ